MTDKPNGNSWSKHQLLVLEKLERHEEWLKSIDKRLVKLREDIVILKLKAGAWGLAGGLIPVLIAGLVAYMRAQP